jgi:hypothetical protein
LLSIFPSATARKRKTGVATSEGVRKWRRSATATYLIER